MKLEDLVTNLEISRKLCDLGIEQSSYFWWEKKYIGTTEKPIEKWVVYNSKEVNAFTVVYSAFTISELGEILLNKFPYPMDIITRWYDSGCFVDIQFPRTYHGRHVKKRIKLFRGINDFQMDNLDNLPDMEADARGKILVYLLENKLI